MDNFGLVGIAAALCLAAAGSALGIGTAGVSAVGAWKRCYLQNEKIPFLLFAFIGAPLTQTFYGLILMNSLLAAVSNVASGQILGAGLLGGLAMGCSAWYQGKAAAAASDAFAKTGKGFTNYIIVLGLIESVALFVMVFLFSIIS